MARYLISYDIKDDADATHDPLLKQLREWNAASTLGFEPCTSKRNFWRTGNLALRDGKEYGL